MKKILFIVCCIICFCSCSSNRTHKDYKEEIDNRIEQITVTTKIERDGHTYIVFHNLHDSFGVVHDPDCYDN